MQDYKCTVLVSSAVGVSNAPGGMVDANRLLFLKDGKLKTSVQKENAH